MNRIVLPVVALLAFLVSCSDDTTSSANNVANNANNTNNGTGNNTVAPTCFDADQDNAFAGANCATATDCDDNDAARYPGATEVCGDRKDNNCDGVLDDGCPCLPGSTRLCHSTVNPTEIADDMVCRPGLQACEGGAWSTSCVGEVGPQDELCDGLDNNCDGVVDEGLLNPLGQCLSEFPTVPEENCGPTGEGNGLDENGDGQVDETCSCAVPDYDPNLPRKDQPCYSGPPATLGVGVCAAGKRSCTAAGTWEACVGDVKPGLEVCGDQLDNDCDGQVDENCSTCTPSDEVCDGIDNNCDGVIDEGVRNACGGCGPVADQETCDDGVDNNCNGFIDEGCGCTSASAQCFGGAPENAGVGVCNWGSMACTGEYYGTCTGFTLPGLELCGTDGLGDDLDNDCDGQVDEDCGCRNGTTRLCGDGAGTCEYGTQTCADHIWGPCEGGVGPVTEVCDNQDNDCDGIVDDGLLNACGTCSQTCYATVFDPTNPGFDNMLDGAQVIGAADPENLTGRAGVTLSKTTKFLPYLWAANSSLDTVSKFNTQNETEEGRYFVADNPSRTAIDLNGNAWVGGRGDGRLTQIISDKTACPDRNNNGVIDTSSGTNVLNSAADYFADECVAYSEVVNPQQPSVRGVAVDPNGKIWVGYSVDGAGNGGVQSVDPNNNYAKSVRYPIVGVPEFQPNANGDLVATGVNRDDDQVYGVAVDANGYLYAAVWSWAGIARFNTNTAQWDAFYTGLSCGPYGVAVDGYNRVWVGCWNGDGGIAMVDTNTNKAYTFRVPTSVGATPAVGTTATVGTAADHQKWFSSAITIEPVSGDAYVTFTNGFIGRLKFDQANPAASTYTFLSGVRDPANTAARLANTGTGDMRGVGFDSDGYLWHLGIPTANILKFDVTTNSYLRMVSVGDGGHYTYSDFTGSAAFNFTAPRGFWRMTFDTGFENARVDGVYMEAYVPAGTTLGVRVRALDNAGNPMSDWSPAAVNGVSQYMYYTPGANSHTQNLAAPLQGGSQFEVEVLMTTTDRDVRPILHDFQLNWQRP